MRIYANEVGNHIGKNITVKGFAQEVRDLKNIKFIVLRDISGFVQTIALKKITDPASFEAISKLTAESAVSIDGAVVANKEAKQGYELQMHKLETLNIAEPLPLDISGKTNTSVDTRLDHRFLDTRRKEIAAIFKVRSSIYRSLVDFFADENFVTINTPKLTTIGLESGAEVFKVDYFGKEVVLAQSPQFYKQMFTVGGFEKVFEIGPVFRAEKSHTTRHLTEFTGADFEMGFIKDENDIMDLIEKMFKFVIKEVRNERSVELGLLNVDLKIPTKIPRIPMAELKKMLAKKGKKLSENDDLDAEAERIIGEYALKEFGEEFIFVTDYPAKVRPFYHMRPENNPKGTRSFDLLWRGVEIATGAQREHRLPILQAQAKEKGITIPPIYEDIFKYGAMPHGGVGFGIERLTQRMLNLENVREGTLLPRDVERVAP